jgi:formate dehydrogenase subunit gamma
MNTPVAKPGEDSPATGSYPENSRLERHELVDRTLHWLIALAMITLLCTGLLPVLGVKFEWVLIHWVAGILLTLVVIVHIIRVMVLGRLPLMKLSKQEVVNQIEAIHGDLTRPDNSSFKTGKYSPAQKGYHYAMVILVLTAIATGLFMLIRIDSPFWDRDPYLLTQEIWGFIYVLHGFSALGSISLIMIHIYFALRPEKLFYTRSMLLGWITPGEHQEYHDPALWLPDILTAKAKNSK